MLSLCFNGYILLSSPLQHGILEGGTYCHPATSARWRQTNEKLKHMGLKNKIIGAGDYAGDFLSKFSHAQQPIPGQHRLLAAGGMFAGWIALDKLRDIVFGVNQVSEGEYHEIKREDVPAPLRFLHKTIDWNPHSDAPEEQWKKLAHQLIPAIGAAAGTVAGSMLAFEHDGKFVFGQNSKAHAYSELKNSKGFMSILNADHGAQVSQARTMRILTAATGGFSAASMMPLMYGAMLNLAFATANGSRIFASDIAMGGGGSVLSHDAAMKAVDKFAKSVVTSNGKVSDAWAEGFVKKVLGPMFSKNLKDPKAQAEVREKIKAIIEREFNTEKGKNLSGEALNKALTDDIKRIFGNSKDGLDKTLVELGLDKKDATLGNAIPLVRGFNEFLVKLGIGKKTGVESWKARTTGVAPENDSSSNLGKIGIGVGVAAAGVTAGAMALNSNNASQPKTEQAISPNGHLNIDTDGKSAAEYVADAMHKHQEQYKNQTKTPPKLLQWVGDASLAVPPINRMMSAIGLTAGLKLFGDVANIVTGRKLLDGSEFAKKDVPRFLQKFHGIAKYDPNAPAARNKWMRYAHFATYALGGILGVKVGSDLAYRDVKEKNKDPHYLEEYLTNVSHTQGKTWSWLSATSGIWGSASGAWAVPLPGVNYAVGMVGRVTSMQDRNTMVAGLNKWTSDATTSSYLRLKEGVHYLAHHAVENPAKDPTQIEYIAYTLLGPLFKDKLTANHIKQFTDAVHTVRDKYWQEGGIPKDKKAEALSTMKEVFTGAGLEVLLIDMGLNPAAVAFDKVNGLIGKIGDIGHKKEIKDKQEAYWKELEGRLSKYENAGIVSKGHADWVREGIEEMRNGRPQKSPPPPLETDMATHAAKDIADAKTVASALGVKPKQGIEELLQSAEKQGDWREHVLQQRQNMETQRTVSE